VRELENAVEYGVNMAFGDIIGIDAVPARLLRNDSSTLFSTNNDLPLAVQVKRFEREIISNKLKKYGTNGNGKDKVAQELGLSRATLYRKLSELDLS
jgi:transcriptional regulator with PAS, ATPase and Fis domain